MGLNYIELLAMSQFSFLRAASSPEELVQQAFDLGYQGLALTDWCSLSGVVRAYRATRELPGPFQLLVGARFILDDANGLDFCLLACDRQGYGELSALITRARRAAEKSHYRLTADDIAAANLSACVAIALPRYQAVSADQARIEWLASQVPDRCWIGALLLARQADKAHRQDLNQLAQRLQLPIVACGDVRMHRRSRRALLDAMSAIRLGKRLDDLGWDALPNGEQHLRPLSRIQAIFPSAWIAQSQVLARHCHFDLGSLRYEYPDDGVPPSLSPSVYLRQLCLQGAAKRFPEGLPEKVAALLEHELAIIAELHYEAYFLTVADIVRFARSRGILCQGRGSAANSVVCYCLGITAVDPSRMSMLFERFVSRERAEPPDIDVDFEHHRREEVIAYIYQRYGRDRAALTASVISYRPRSALTDLGKALGLPLELIRRLSASLAWWDGLSDLPERLQQQGLDATSPRLQRLLQLLPQLVGVPRHLSQHVGGFVISRGPLSRLVPIENARAPTRSVIQWDKDDLETLGLMKVDILALGMLTAINKALGMVSRYSGKALNLADVPAEDPAVYRMISRAQTMGVFQIESRAQMAMLPRIQPRCFYDLVIEVAIVRPGPIQGDMVHPYLQRRQGLEPVIFPSDEVRSVLERTLGVPIFQEQVMQLAQVAAGFSGGEADQLRRAMAAWRKRGGLEPFEARLMQGMAERGYSEDFARALYQQILGFGEYGFPESHAASFALLVYVSAWLKCHHPAAFCAALLNAQPMGFYAPAQLVRDAREHGVEVLPVDVQQSVWDCRLVKAAPHQPPRLRLGLRLIKGLQQSTAKAIAQARERGGRFQNMADLKNRCHLPKPQLETLAAAGALGRLSGNRYLSFWQAMGLTEPLPLWQQAPNTPTTKTQPFISPPSEAAEIAADYRHLGLSLGRHPLALIRKRLSELGFDPAKRLWQQPAGSYARACGLVLNRQRPQTASGVVFITLEDETGFVNVVIWAELSQRYRQAVLSGKLLGVVGCLQREAGVQHLLAERLEIHDSLLNDLSYPSRDFC